MVTIKDVASLADVSISTVSRVLNDKDKVSEETREKVLRASKELNYQPNFLAKGLKSMQSNTIGVLIENITNPYFAEVILGLQHEAIKNNYSVFFCDNEKDDEKVIANIDSLLNKMVDGIIYISGKPISEEIKDKFLNVIDRKTPLILVGKTSLDLDLVKLITNDRSASYKVVNHLLNLGHRDIAFIGGDECYYIAQDRVRGYKDAMDEFGLSHKYNINYGEYGANIVRNAMKLTEKVLSADKRPTAIYAADDLIATGTIIKAKEMGFNIPNDLSVVGCNNFRHGQYLDPSLTSIDYPRYEIGKVAFEKLYSQMKNLDTKIKDKDIVFDGKIIIRESCGTYPHYKVRDIY